MGDAAEDPRPSDLGRLSALQRRSTRRRIDVLVLPRRGRQPQGAGDEVATLGDADRPARRVDIRDPGSLGVAAHLEQVGTNRFEAMRRADSVVGGEGVE